MVWGVGGGDAERMQSPGGCAWPCKPSVLEYQCPELLCCARSGAFPRVVSAPHMLTAAVCNGARAAPHSGTCCRRRGGQCPLLCVLLQETRLSSFLVFEVFFRSCLSRVSWYLTVFKRISYHRNRMSAFPREVKPGE